MPWFAPLRRSSVLLLGIMTFGEIAYAQVPSLTTTTETPVDGIGHDYIHSLDETVLPANGALSIRIAAPTPQERGINLPTYPFVFDSNGMYNLYRQDGTGDLYLAAAPPGEHTSFQQPYNSLSTQSKTATIAPLPGASYGSTCDYTTGYLYVDPYGGQHPFALQRTQDNPQNTTNGSCGGSIYNVLAAGDESYSASLDWATWTVQITDAHGTVITFPGAVTGTTMPTMEDTNGNAQDGTGRQYVGVSGGLSTSVSVPGIAAPYQINYGTVASGGTPPSVTLNATSETNYPGTTLCGNLTYQLGVGVRSPTTVTLPDGQQYVFTYDPVFGYVNHITYPTGATVTYTWNLIPQSQESMMRVSSPPLPRGSALCSYRYDWPAITKRVISFDGVNPALEQDFSYTTTWDSTTGYWGSKQTTVVNSDLTSAHEPNRMTIYNYSPMYPTAQGTVVEPVPVESSIVYENASGGIMQTVTKTWPTQRSYFDTLPQQLLAECTTDQSGLTSGIFYQYEPNPTFAVNFIQSTNEITDKAEYDYGLVTSACTQPSSPPTRETVTTYQSFAATPLYPASASILDRPESVKVYGDGTLMAETDYAYQTSVTGVTPAAIAHDEVNYGFGSTFPRGNATLVTRRCFPSCSNSVTTYGYDETGQKISMMDSNGNLTQYSYLDSYTSDDGSPTGNTNTYLTKVTNPQTNGISHIQSFRYGFNDGKLRSTIDENSQTTGYCYLIGGCSGGTFDPWFRATETDLPDGGRTLNSYSDAGPLPSVTTNSSAVPDPNIVNVSTVDGMGHAIKTQVTSDPWNVSTVSTQYDGEGEVYAVTILAAGSTTRYLYDALGRKTIQAQPDGTSFLQWCYDGVPSSGQSNCLPKASSQTGEWVDYSDEDGVHWQRVTDGLGRLVAVVELGTPTTPLHLETDYQYNALDDLIKVNQTGNSSNGDTPRTRNFTYDSLSRLTTSTNPETGTISYSYDANGNLQTKTDNRNTTTFSYDALNRVLGKTYSDGLTPSACYTYDQALGKDFGYGQVGRLVSEWTQPGACTFANQIPQSAISWKKITSYDAMGRVQIEEQCPLEPCFNASIGYTYDLAGKLTSSTNGIDQAPEAATTSYTADGAGRLATVTSSWNDATHPATLFAANQPIGTTNPYGAFGLTAAQLGISTSSQTPALAETLSYDNRGRIISKKVVGAPSGSGIPTPIVTTSISSTAFSSDDPATVSVHVSCNTACGNVDYREDNQDWATVPLDSNGNFSSSFSYAPNQYPGQHTVVIQYLGNGTYAPASSNTVGFTILQPGTTPTIATATVTPNPFLAIDYSAVSLHVGCNSACGFIMLTIDGSNVGEAQLDDNGNYTFGLGAFSAVGSHAVVFQYLGNATYAPTTSNTVSYTVLAVGTTVPTISAAISKPSFAAADPATVSVHVGCSPTCGSVDYREDNQDWATVPLDSNGNSNAPTSFAPNQQQGLHTMYFQYLGDTTYAPVASSTLSYTIEAPGTTATTTVATITSNSFAAANPANVTVQVGCNSSCGLVDFKEDGVEWGTVPLSNTGSFTSATSYSPNQSPGNHTVTIQYLGNATYAAMPSNTVSYTITQ